MNITFTVHKVILPLTNYSNRSYHFLQISSINNLSLYQETIYKPLNT